MVNPITILKINSGADAPTQSIEDVTAIRCRGLFDMELIIKSPKYGEHVVLYDEQDHELINKYRWHLRKFPTRNYAVANVFITRKKNRPISMHRLIMGFPEGMEVDHVDLNGLNNQRSNLRLATHSQNNMNKRNQSNNKTGFKGVHHFKRDDNYQAYIMVDKKRIHGGYFKTAKEAAKKYNELAIKYHGEFAKLNIISYE